MTLTWYGHSCFLLETEKGSVVFDPYEPGSVPGLALPELEADAVICSHGHRDHGSSAAVRLTGRRPDFDVLTLPSYHDDRQGALRGENRLTLIDDGELRLLHLGDLGCELDAGQLAALGRVDVLLIPVGGYYTIDARQAKRTADALGARTVVPMHYRGEGFGYAVLAPVDDYLALCGNVRVFDTNALGPEELGRDMTAVLRCPVNV